MHHRSLSRPMPLGVGLAAALVLSLAVPLPAAAAPPDPAVLVTPADGATTASVSPTLSVRATDPDGGSVDVTFEGRQLGATVPGETDAEPFTLVIVPDTQNYSYANQTVLDRQLEWVRDSVDELDTAFVIQVGDLVSEWTLPNQWQRISQAFRILDDASVPNSVLPGNHDFDNATGDMGPFNTYFPVARYAQAAWNTATTRYGGHLGQDQFGDDEIDRGNADNFALFTAGGRDYLVLNLEWEAPGYALAWAERVMAAHPDRTVILATHSFLTVDGNRMATPQRPGGTSTAALWEDFVAQHCQIRLVVAGHSHDGNRGEARRADNNSCGQPVQQVLTDYQGRPNGGDGWLRYYTFDPAQNTMAATTYSPVLDAYETDADSSFTVPFEVAATQEAPFIPIATRTVAAGSVASAPWSGLEYDTGYEWRAVVADASDTSTSPTWALRTPEPPVRTWAADTFDRSVSGGWGAADVGGAWAVTGGSAASLSVQNGQGRASLARSQTRIMTLPGVTTDTVDITVDLAAAQASTGGASHSTVIARQVGNTHYGLIVRFEAAGVLRLYLVRDNTALGTRVTTWSPGQPITVRIAATGTSPTQLTAKAWPTGTPEPATWQMTATDNTPALQTPGTLALKAAVSSTSTVPTTVLTFNDYRATSPGTP